ncbi:MAG: hypothetical protein ACXQTP_01120 [Candidatus Methanofastidiosia archaeon]
MIKNSRDIIDEIVEKYNKNPRDWHVTLGSDNRGRYVVLITKNKHLWQIKAHHITPYNQISVGGKTKTSGKFQRDDLTFGWRNLTPKMLIKIREDIKNKGEISKELIEEINEIETQPFDSDFEGILQGPIKLEANPVSIISKEQKKLDNLLTIEIEKLLLKKEGGGMYH